jgi:transcription elongation factor GreA
MARRRPCSHDELDPAPRRGVTVTVLVPEGKRLPITAAGYAERCRELDRLMTVERRRLSGLLHEARKDGSLEDNPTLVDLLDEQEQLEHRIAVLEARLSAAEVAPPPCNGSAAIGTVVRVRDTATGSVLEYELVGPIESDAANGRISIAAPVGRALTGQRRGGRVEVATPSGRVHLEVLDVASAATLTEAA